MWKKGGGMLNYRIDEFVEEVMSQLKGFVRPDEKVHFELDVYNAYGMYTAEEANSKGVCVICGREIIAQELKYSPRIRFSVKMR